MPFLGAPGRERRAVRYFDFSVFVPEQHCPQHAPQMQLVVMVVVVSTVFAMSTSALQVAKA